MQDSADCFVELNLAHAPTAHVAGTLAHAFNADIGFFAAAPLVFKVLRLPIPHLVCLIWGGEEHGWREQLVMRDHTRTRGAWSKEGWSAWSPPATRPSPPFARYVCGGIAAPGAAMLDPSQLSWRVGRKPRAHAP